MIKTRIIFFLRIHKFSANYKSDLALNALFTIIAKKTSVN